MIDVSKIDLKRSKDINQKIILWFEYLINTPNIGSLVEFYHRQGYLLYVEKRHDLLRFYGCDENIDHHSSNIEYVVKFLCHKILHDYGKNKILFDHHDLALAGFGFTRMSYYIKNSNGDILSIATDVKNHKVVLYEKQIQILRGILRMIEGKNPYCDLFRFENSFDYREQAVNEFSKLTYENKKKYLEFRNPMNYQEQSHWATWWNDRELWQWFSAEKVFA